MTMIFRANLPHTKPGVQAQQINTNRCKIDASQESRKR